MAGDLQGKAFLINACVYSVTVVLNQQSIPLRSMVFRPNANNPDEDGFSKLDTNVVDLVNGGDVPGKLGSANTLQLLGEQFSVSGSPKFDIKIDTMRLPVKTSTVYVYVFFNTLVCTNGAGQRVGIQVTSANPVAARLMAL